MFHWCESAGDFSAAWDEAWRVLRPGGIFHARFLIQDFASDTKTGWFLIDGTALREKVMRCGGEWLEVLQAEEESARFTLKKPAR
jgi:ubiquinone/menaquinone biosynthesis C-methylase UbiE